jgi:hypothetical protein
MIRFFMLSDQRPISTRSFKKPRVDNLEFSSEHTTRVDVGGVWLEALVEAENLGSTGSWHGCNERVADTMLLDCCFKLSQSQRSVGVTPHMSYWSSPLDAGEPS